MSLITEIFLFIVLPSAYLWWTLRDRNSKLPPMAPIRPYLVFPIISHTYDFITNPDFTAQSIRKVGHLFRLNTLLGMRVLMSGPDAIKWAWRGDRKYMEWDMEDHWAELIGRHSISGVYGQKHAKMRSVFTKAFSPKSLAGYVPCVQNCVQEFVASLVKSDGVVEVFPMAKRFALDISLKLTFSVDSKTDGRLQYVFDDFCVWVDGLATLVQWNIPGTSWYNAMKARERLLVTFQSFVDERKKELTDPNRPERNDLLANLLGATDEDGRPFTNEELIDNLMNIVWASHDTSASMLSSSIAITFAEADKEKFEKLRKEVLTAFPLDRDLIKQPVTFDEIQSLDYLDAWVKELLRIRSPIAAMFRKMSADATYDGPLFQDKNSPQADYFLPSGSKVLLDYRTSMLNNAYYPNPNHFEPERFLNGRDEDKKSPFTYTPFGGGVRTCLGYGLAKLEIKMFMALLVRGLDIQVLASKPLAFPLSGSNPSIRASKISTGITAASI